MSVGKDKSLLNRTTRAHLKVVCLAFSRRLHAA